MFGKIYSRILSEELSQLNEAIIEEKKGARCTKVTGQQSSSRSDKKYMCELS